MMMLPPNAPAKDYERIRENLGLDKPLHVQYGRYFRDLLRGDFGDSIIQNVPATDLILDRLPATILLTSGGLIFSLIVGIPVGIISAIWKNSWLDYSAMTAALLGISMPSFWRGLMLIMAFALYIRIFPVSGYGEGFFGRLYHLVLPSIGLGSGMAALIARLTRSELLDVLGMDYVNTARSKGLKENKVIIKHALRNAMIPVVTVVGLNFAYLMGGAMITETVFAWPGIGRLAVNSIRNLDFPVVTGVLVMVAFGFVIINLLVDLSYCVIDPRIRYE